MRKRLVTCLVGVLVLTMAMGLIIGWQAFAQAQSTKEVTLVNLEFEGTKVWLPGTVVVKKGIRSSSKPSTMSNRSRLSMA